MPLYDYKCSGCEEEFEDLRTIAERYNVSCPTCGYMGVSILISSAPGLSLFKEGWYNHVGTSPVYCRTPQQLRNACDEAGVRSVYLEESTFKTKAEGHALDKAHSRRETDYEGRATTLPDS